MTAPTTVATTRVDVCHLDDLTPERGVAALVAGEQVAVFRLDNGEVLAVQQEDPFSGSHVMARGLVGSRGEIPTIASPMFKQVFDLRTGQCLEPMGKPAKDLRVWSVQVTDLGRVLIDVPALRRGSDSGSGP